MAVDGIWSKAQVFRKRGPYRNGNRAQSERAPETVFETNMLMGAYGILSMACCHCAFLSLNKLTASCAAGCGW